MTKYKFEIQACIGVVVDADNAEDARMQIVENIKSYADELIRDPYISEGQECNK